MRRWVLRLSPVVVVLLLVGSYPLLAPPDSPVGPAAYERLTNGMTLAEVEAAIGLPAGDYSTRPVMDAEGELRYTDYVKDFKPAFTKRWVTDDTVLEVDFDHEGRLRGKAISPMEPNEPLFFDRVRSHIRSWF